VPVSYHLRGATTVREGTDISRERVSSYGTILVVEDNKALLRLLCKKLEHFSFNIEGVSSGTEALHRIVRRPPDLMLLDYYLPDMTGEQLIRTLYEEKRSVPFVVITG
jgi:CheY-like chemotaxis protein